MMPGLAVLTDASADGFLLPLAIILPVAGILASFVLGGRFAERIALLLLLPGLGVAAGSSLACGAVAIRWFTWWADGSPRSALRCAPTAFPRR